MPCFVPFGLPRFCLAKSAMTVVTLTLSRIRVTEMSSTPRLAPQPTTTATVIAGLFLGTVSFMIMGIQPALLGGLVEEHRLTEAMLGRVAWAEVFALALAAGIGPRLVRLGSARHTI